MPDFELSLNRLLERMDRLEALVESAPRVPAISGYDEADLLDDNTGVITSETPVVGTATKGKRSDAADGLLPVGSAYSADAVLLDTDNPRPDLEFCKNNESPAIRRGLRVRANRPANAAAGDYPATGGETNPTLRTTGDKGLDVLLALPDWGYDASKLARILSVAEAAMGPTRGGLALPLEPDAALGCLKGSAAGLFLDFGDGLIIASNQLKFNMGNGLQKSGGPGGEIEVKPKSGGSITVTADGVDTTHAAHEPATAGTGISVGGTSGQEIGNTDTGSAARTAHENAWNHSSFESLKHQRGHVIASYPSDHTDIGSDFATANGTMMYYYNYAWRSLAGGNEGDQMIFSSNKPTWQAP